MNKIFKTKWSAAHQQYVVTDEHHATKGKAAKSVVAATVAAVAAMAAGVASAAYVGDPGFVASSAVEMSAAKASWETDEYLKNWGLTAMKASSAYALGYHGQGVKVGMMDSGILKGHIELSGDGEGEEGRWHSVAVQGEYGSDGQRYPQNAYGSKPTDTGAYEKGDKFDVNGYYNEEYNDNHGTGCAGVYAGNRNGTGMHGVAWGSEFYSANTGGNDNMNYGPFPDYEFFKKGYDALVAEGVKIINNSFGTNLKQVDEEGNILDYYHSGPELTTVKDIEYEYFLFKKQYADKGEGDNKGKSFVDAAWEAVKGKDVIQVFTNGNNDRANPYHRALYPYFNPEAEAQWIAIAGLRQNDKNTDPNNYKLEANFNEAGYAKYWTLTGPGQNGYTSNIAGVDKYGSYSGTSMAAPFISGAFGVLASRYQDMSAVQVREVLLTTANHKNADGSNMAGWDNVDGSTPREGEVSDRMGWGVPDLEKGMFGPGQFLGKFEYNLKDDHIDVWSNDISQVALEQREREDLAWLEAATDDAGNVVVSDKEEDYKLTNTSTGAANADGKEHNYDLAGVEDKEIDIADAKKWREEYYKKRVDEINRKLAGHLYDGSIVKTGTGKLVMTGDNSYEGTTTVEEGTLLAFAESIGHKQATKDAEAEDPVVTVNRGTFGVLAAYTDNFTKTGYKASKEADAGKLSITLKDGASLYVGAGNVTVKEVTFEGTQKVTVGLEGASSEALIEAYHGAEDPVGTFTTKNGTFKQEAIDPNDKVESLFFSKVEGKVTDDGKSIETTVTRNEDVSFSNFATTKNERAVAEALEASKGGLAGEILGMTNEEAVESTIASFSDDMYAAARNAMVVNALAVTHAVADQARGFGEGRTAELENGNVRLWATGMGYWGDAEGSESSLDVDFRAGLIGAEVNVCPATKLGAFFGAGTTDYKGSFGKIDGDDTHFGVYGLTDYAGLSFTYGVSYMTEDRDSQHVLAGNAYKHSEDASVLQAYAEAAYRFDVAGAQIDPYFGMSWARVESDGFAEGDYATKDREDDIQTATLGARVTMPFTMGTMPVAFKADAGWTHFFGDTEAVSELQLGKNAAFASLEAKELKDQFNVGLGLTAQVAKTATVGVSYTSSFGTDADTHGVMGTVKIAF